MKKIFIVPLLSTAVALCLVSCLEGGGGNKQEGTFPAVVSYNTDIALPTILTTIGEFAAPKLATSDLKKGDCILVRFTLDWDNQPTNKSPFYATNISYLDIDQSYAEIKDDFDEKELIVPADSILPILSVIPQSYHAILNGKVFFVFGHNVSIKQDMDYSMIVKPNEDASTDAAVTVYVICKKNNEPDETKYNVENLYAIDMLNVIGELGEEITVHENGVDIRTQQLKIKIKYCTGVDEQGVPQYQSYYNDGTITLAVYK
ncbi:MAG: hypothetical protein LBS46_04380 [Dysgonamonadaceae bacterium]|jgi:hypothetical protein|nr:hypothetical protein [Dysgonamonadaceae bacterium]